MTALTHLALALSLTINPVPANTAGPALQTPTPQARLDRLVAAAEPRLRRRAIAKVLARGQAEIGAVLMRETARIPAFTQMTRQDKLNRAALASTR